MIILQEELAQEFRKDVLESFCLLDIDFPVPVYLTETDNQVIHDEKIYVSRGFSFDNINSAPGLSVAEIDLLIDNTDQVFSSILMNGDQRGREVKISLGAAIGGPGAVADGSVKTATRANTKISAVDGSAFVDFSESAYLTLPEHRGCKLTVTDSAGKKLVGYIKAAGTGETYGSELITNGDMEAGDPPTGWSPSGGSTLSSVADERTSGSGSKSMNAVRGTSQTPAFNAATAISLGLYRCSAWYRNIDAISVYAAFSGGMGGLTLASTASTDWTYGEAYGTSTTTIAQGNAFLVGAVGVQGRYDDMSQKQVLTPAVTGVTITSTADGSTFNWASKEAGFNYNDASGYTYTIERE